jgi:glutaredoxin
MLAFLRRLIGRKSAPGSIQVCLYTRAGCHLCDRAKEQLSEALKGHDHRLDEVDIDSDAELARRYGDWVPVIVINGKVRFRGAVNGILLRRQLRAER